MKTNFLKSAFAFLMGTALLATSCEDPISQPEVEPAFPESVSKTIAQGESCEIALSANMDWDLVMSGDLRYFTMTYNGEPATTISGKEGEFVVNVKAVKDETDFEQRKVTLTMKMKGAEHVVAEVHRNGSERIFKVYPVKIEDGAFVSGDNGYEFEEETNNNLALIYDGNMLQTFVKVKANFDWALKDVPEWAEINEVEGRYVSAAKANVDGIINLRGLADKYVLDGEEGKLVFVIDDNSENPVAVEQEVVLTQPAVKDIFVAPISLASQIKFNAAGQYYNPMNGEYQERPMTAVSVTGIAGLQAYAVEFNAMGGLTVVGSTDKKVMPVSEWVHFKLTDETPDDVLKTYDFSITVDANSAAEPRKAGLLLIPGAVAVTGEDDLFNDTSDDINPKYSEYMSWFIEQDGQNGGPELGDGAFFADNDQLANSGAKFERLDSRDEENSWIPTADETFAVGTENYYKLTVTKPKGTYTISYAEGYDLWNYLLFEQGTDGELAASGTTWATMQTMDETNRTVSFSIEIGEKWAAQAMKFLIFEGEKGRTAAIYVCYDPDQVIGDGGMITLDNPNSGDLNKMAESAPEYEYLVSEYGCKEIYELTWNGQMINGSVAFNYDSIDVDEYSQEWLSCYPAGEGRIMLMGYAETMSKGFVLFKDANGVVVAVLVCTADPNWQPSGEGGEGGEDSITADGSVLAAACAKFEKMKDNGNFADAMLPILNDYFGLGEDNYYVLTITKTSGTYSGFTYAKQFGGYTLYDYPEYDADWEEWSFNQSAESWAELSEGSISITWPEDDWSQKFILVKSLDADLGVGVRMAVICVSRE